MGIVQWWRGISISIQPSLLFSYSMQLSDRGNIIGAAEGGRWMYETFQYPISPFSICSFSKSQWRDRVEIEEGSMKGVDENVSSHIGVQLRVRRVQRGRIRDEGIEPFDREEINMERRLLLAVLLTLTVGCLILAPKYSGDVWPVLSHTAEYIVAVVIDGMVFCLTAMPLSCLLVFSSWRIQSFHSHWRLSLRTDSVGWPDKLIIWTTRKGSLCLYPQVIKPNPPPLPTADYVGGEHVNFR